ncbi:MAG: prolyl oligopeptidase family serine peptidase [Chloroherpetonaceae bacterium]|nr:prolyl oligopeptidase family serine peptidase [Chthonomonadaceae bacterium]MDW8207180.1 prolyl oligopeptidase family serine peptidase [Chloroherpetonaceae bacterium]
METCFRQLPLALLLLIPLILAALTAAGSEETPRPPVTRREDVTEILHGVAITDPYRWLEDQESPETRAWIDAQNAYTDALLDPLPHRKPLEARLTALRRFDVYGIPTARTNRYFYSRRRPQDEQNILYVREGLQGPERVLVDPHPLSTDHTTSVYFVDISHDGDLVAYAIQQGGDDQSEIRFLDVATGKELPDRLPRSFYEGLDFTRDRKGCYYSRLTPLVGRRVYYHALGTDTAADVEVFGKDTKPEDIISVRVSENGRWLLLTVWHGWSRNDLYLKDLTADGPIRPLVTGLNATIVARFADDRLIAQTDWQAPNRRIVEIDLEAPQPERWREIVPEASDAIEDYALTGGKLFVQYLHNVQTQIRIYHLDGKHIGDLPLPGTGTATVPYGRWDATEGFYTFQTFTSPPTIYRYDVPNSTSSVWAKPEVPLRTEDFEIRQVWAVSKDGTRVPLFLVQCKGLVWDGARPTVIYAYGGFNVSLVPYWSTQAVVWAEQGGVFVVANLRGGGEFGEAWHRAGMLDRKQNVFDDLYACAEWLIQNGVTRPEKLAVQGGSNGGLLVGVAITQRPSLFRAAICAVPLLDMLRYHRFLQGPQWIPEYGTAEDPEQFKTLYAYSPYHHVRPGEKYPAVLFTTGDLDTRVAPLHARKMTALLQHATGSGHPVLLHYETRSGHSGGKPLGQQIVDQAREIGFLLWQLGVPPPAAPPAPEPGPDGYPR